MREHSSAGSHGGCAALEEIHKYLSGYIAQACENQTQETHPLFSFQKCSSTPTPGAPSVSPDFPSVLHYSMALLLQTLLEMGVPP